VSRPPPRLTSLAAYSFTANATDADVPAQALGFSLVGPPAGASISAAGVFSWTPTEAQGPGAGPYSFAVRVSDGVTYTDQPVTLTVKEVNEAPDLTAIGNKTVDEGAALTFAASATDSDLPANTLTFSLDAGAPAGASINASTGAFSWTPPESAGGTTISITIRVTDNGTPTLTDSETINVSVNEANAAPVLSSIGNKSVNEGSLLTFAASAVDSDIPANTLTYSLGPGAPEGAAINPATGVFTWTPVDGTASSSYSATIIVTDNGQDEGKFKTPTLRDIEVTGPYMHDGSFKSLQEVLNFYDGGGHPNAGLDPDIRPLHLTAAEKNALLTFLKSLTGSRLSQ